VLHWLIRIITYASINAFVQFSAVSIIVVDNTAIGLFKNSLYLSLHKYDSHLVLFLSVVYTEAYGTN